MKKTLVILFCIFTISLLNGQSRFNKMYDFFGNADVAFNIFEIKDGLLVFGTAYDSLNFGRLAVLKLDENGNEIEKKTILFPNINFGLLNTIFSPIDSSYYVIGTSQFSNLKITAHLVKLNKNAELLWDKFVIDTAYNTQGLDLIMNKPNELLIVGNSDTLDPGGTDVESFLLSTDTLGEKNYCKYYNLAGLFESFLSIKKTIKGDFLIGGNTYDVASYFNKAMVILLDSSGNLKWRKIYTGIYSSGGARSFEIDSNLIFNLGSFGVYPDFPTGAYQAPIIRAFNKNGSLLWNKLYDTTKTGVYNNFDDLVFINDTVIITGTMHMPGSGSDIGLFFTNNNGDTVICRRYYKFGTTYDFSFDIIKTFDQGFAIAGCNYPYSGVSQNFRVIKTDKYGCDTANCQIYDGINEIQTTVNQYNLIKVWPNPVSDKLYLTIDNVPESYLLKTTVNIYDINGKHILQNNTTNHLGYIQTDVSALPAGIYTGEVYIHTTRIGYFKIVKNQGGYK